MTPCPLLEALYTSCFLSPHSAFRNLRKGSTVLKKVKVAEVMCPRMFKQLES